MQHPTPQRRLVAPLHVEGPIPPRLRNSPYLSQSSTPRPTGTQPSPAQPWHDLAEPPLTAAECARLNHTNPTANGQQPNRRSSSTDHNPCPRSIPLPNPSAPSPHHYVPGLGIHPSSSSSPSGSSNGSPGQLGSLPRVFSDSDEEELDLDHPRRASRGQSVPAFLHQHPRRA